MTSLPFTFFVPGEPKPAPRPRHRLVMPKGRKPFVTTYVPDSDKAWRKHIALKAKHLAEGRVFTGPVWLELDFLMPRPQSHFGTGRNAGILKPNAPFYHTGWPDRDNLEKTVSDALQDARILGNDSVICDGPIRKRYPRAGEQPGVHIWMLSLEAVPPLFPNELPATGRAGVEVSITR